MKTRGREGLRVSLRAVVPCCVLLSACSLAFPLDKYRADPLDASGGEDSGTQEASPEIGGDSTAETIEGGDAADACGTYKGTTLVPMTGFCIDATEVTHAQYNAFLAAGVPLQSVTGSPAFCNWNADYGSSVSGRDDYPVVNVDRCDAYAYCTWAGKRLCGSTEGGPVYPDSAATSLGQWYFACSNGAGTAATKWPYGNTFSNSTCNGDPTHLLTNAPAIVASYANCHGTSPPFDRVFDMSGNVQEWVDSCYESVGATDGCVLAGGYWASDPGTDLACDHSPTYPRNTLDERVGFRCCK